MAEEAKGVEVLEAPITTVEIRPTLADIAGEGLAPAEVELATKHKLVETEKNEEAKAKPDLKVIKPDVKEAKAEEQPETAEEMAADPKAQAAIIDPAKEADLLKGFDHKGKGLYWKMKSETLRRQAVETEKEHVQIKLKAAEDRAKRLEEENKVLKTTPAKPAVKAEPKLDAFGNAIEEPVVDEKDKPLTKKDLEDIEAKKTEAAKKEQETQEERNARATVLVTALNAQEADAQAQYEDFDTAMTLADTIVRNAKNIASIFPDQKKQTKALMLSQAFFHATRNADKFKEGDYNAADIAYELGTMHPDYKPNGDGKLSKSDGGIDPEKAKKVIENSGKRGSSAALPAGGGKRFVPYEEMNAETLSALSPADYAKVPKEVRQKILRGE